ncbi:MAG: CD1375 family protein [Oscillospiraceae bacterium]
MLGLYIMMIKKGKITLADVPTLWRDSVALELAKG